MWVCVLGKKLVRFAKNVENEVTCKKFSYAVDFICYKICLQALSYFKQTLVVRVCKTRKRCTELWY